MTFFLGLHIGIFVRYLYKNFHDAGYHSSTLEYLRWNAARASYVAEFERWINEIATINKEVHDWLVGKPAERWSWSHFSTFPQTDVLLNNEFKVLNEVLLPVRDKPILTMLEIFKVKLMTRMHTKRDSMRKYSGSICPKIKKKLGKTKDESFRFAPMWSGGPKFQVNCGNGQFAVDLEQKTCRKWELTGIPCGHAITASIMNI